MLDHERLDVYRCATRFAALSFQILDTRPCRLARYHAIARGSAMECGAIVDLLSLQGLAPASELDEAKALRVRVVGMLTKMCK